MTRSPAGDGWGTVEVKADGAVTMNGALGDGSLLAQGAVLSRAGEWPLYVPLYAGRGTLLGWLTFTNLADRSLWGDVSWIKPSGVAGPLYARGFTNETESQIRRRQKKTRPPTAKRTSPVG